MVYCSSWKAIFLFYLITIDEIFALLEFDISCTDSLSRLNSIPASAEEIILHCPKSCLKFYSRVIGSNPYSLSSSPCHAAVHVGAIINENGGFILINISHDSISSFHGTNRNEVKSRGSSAHTVGYFFIEIPVKNSVTSSSYNNNNYEYTAPLLPTTREKFIGKTTNFIAMETVTSQPKTLKVNSWKDEISAITQTSKSSMPQWAQSDTAQFELNITGMLNATTTIRMNVNRTDTAANMSLSEEIQTNESKTMTFLLLTTLLTVIPALIFISILIICCTRMKPRSEQTKDNQNVLLTWHARRRNKFWHSVSKSNSSKDDEFCVCYNHIDSQKQGLLYDPETCDRPCSIRRSILKEVPNSLTSSPCSVSSYSASICPNVTVPPTQNTDCSTGCSGRCNPSQFEF